MKDLTNNSRNYRSKKMLQYQDSDWCTFNERWQNLMPYTLGIQFHVSSIYLADVFLMK